MGKRATWLSAFKKAFKPPPIASETSPARDAQKVQPLALGKLSLISPQNHFEEKRNWCIGLPSTQEFLDVSPKDSNYVDGHFTQNEEQSKTSLAVASATAAAVAAGAVVRLTGAVRKSFHGWNPNEECAAVKIQAAFRAYLARTAFRALKALVRLQAWARGHRVRRQSAWAMRCIQALTRVQTRVRARRDKIAKDSEATQRRQLWERSQREAHKKKSLIDVSIKEGWDESSQSAEVLEMKRNKQLEAAMKRERALAYAYSQKQWRTDPKEASSIASTYNDYEPDNPHWGWGWLEHWMAGVPLENSAPENHGLEEFSEKETDDGASTPLITDSAARLSTSSNRKHTVPPAKMRASPSRGSSAKQASAPPSAPKRPLPVRIYPASPRSKRVTDDNPSPISILRGTPPTTIRSFIRSDASESFNWEDESMISSPERPSYMIPTKATSRSSTKPNPTNPGTPQRTFAAPSERRLSLPMSQAPTKTPSFRRAFTPMKRSAIDNSSIDTPSFIGYGRQSFR